VKKPNNSSLAATLRRNPREDNENKKVGVLNEEMKRKQIEKINKIIERSNEFVNELMARKNNDHILKKIAPKPNIANASMYADTAKKMKDSPLVGSPNKKIRTISRKK
jgi:competence transcription factor ComK